MLYADPGQSVSPGTVGTRGRLIAIRLNESERRGLDRIAASRGVGLSALVRGLILALLAPPAAKEPAPLAPAAPVTCVVLGDAPRDSWTEEFRILGERAAQLEAHRKRLSGMASKAKIPTGFQAWAPEKRAGWLDQNYPIAGIGR